MFQKKALIIGNMKVLSVILLGVFALGIVTFKSVTSLPKVKTTPAPFDWTQFLPAGIPSAERRAAVGDDLSPASNGVYGAVPPNPMSPYLSLKPFLPVKPTLVPPFVDPNLFIGKKAELLSNLFGTGTGVGPAPAGTPSFIPPWISGGVITSPSFFAEKKTTLLGTTLGNPATDISSSSLDSKRALSGEESTVSAEPRLVGGPSLWGPPAGVGPSLWGPPAGVIPTPKPTIVPPGYWSPFPAGAPAAGPVPPVVDPSVMLDKKTKFLSDLFNSLATATSTPGVSARAVVPDTEPVEPTIVPPSYWLQFIPAFATPPPAPTVKPTIVPPSFWIPSAVSKPVGLFGPPVPVVDPAEMIDKKTAFLNALFSSLNISVTPAPVTTPAPTLDPVAAYQEKVADFLDKLFSAIVNNDTNEVAAAKRALEVADKTKTAEDLKDFLGQIDVVEDNAAKLESELDTRSTFERSIDDSNDTATTTAPQLPVDALLTAKDKVVHTIMAEMGGIKNDILDTLAELLAKQKEAAATPPPTPAPKKKPGPPFGPGGPFGAGAFGPWAGAAAATTTTPKPTPDPAPFQKKVEFLSQVFDTLTQLEKDVTEALNQAVSEAAAVAATAAATAATPTTPEPQATQSSVPSKQNGTTLFDLIRSKLVELANSTAPPQQVVQQVPKYARAIIPFPGKPAGPPTPAPTIVDPSFWIPDAAAGIPVGPDYYMGKTQAFLSKLFASKATTSTGADDDDDGTTASKARSIKMAVHQGYQSLPPGSEELLQAGGGSTPQKHEGGGLKLQESAPTVIPSFFQGGSNNHRHHNHHNRE